MRELGHDAKLDHQPRHLIDRAMRVARASRTVTCVIFPKRRPGGRVRRAAARARRGLRVDVPDQVAGAWDEALAADRPVVLEAVTDPEVPPLPPHIRFEQAKNLAKAPAGGEPERGRLIRQTLKGTARELLRR